MTTRVPVERRTEPERVLPPVRQLPGSSAARSVEDMMPHLRNRHFLALDVLLLPAMLAVAVLVVASERGTTVAEWVPRATVYLVASLAPRLAVLLWAGLYRRLWRYASVHEVQQLVLAGWGISFVGLLANAIVGRVLGRPNLPLSLVLLESALCVGAITVPRLGLRVLSGWGRPRSLDGRRVLVVGAGEAGGLIVRELSARPEIGLVPIGFIDDDARKHHHWIHNVPVLGDVAALERIAREQNVAEVIVAMPSAPGHVIRKIVEAAAAAGIGTRTVPGIYEILSGRKAVSALRRVEIGDLLRREPVETDLASVGALATGKTVLVTGAGGSIGSELCRQLARLEPARLVALGRGENSVFELVEELRRTNPGLAVDPVIVDVRDPVGVERVFREHRPTTVFHAAAHKHVPLMERNVAEAILNNVRGTRVVGEMANRFGAERFVLISSDKAVRPSSVMGATKRLAEGVVQALGAEGRCRFMSVRFGNVLGSRGSVIPTFLRQIEAGGPVTITDPKMRRYFMTIPEAVQLVLQAGAIGDAGDVFVLDMGEPVQVLDLARDLIRLSGLEEGRDIEIRFTGMRPGEKLYEELFFGAESAIPTTHAKILRARNASLEVNGPFSIADLISLAETNASQDELRRGIKELVPEFTGIVGDRPAPMPPSRPAPEPDQPRTAPRRDGEGDDARDDRARGERLRPSGPARAGAPAVAVRGVSV